MAGDLGDSGRLLTGGGAPPGEPGSGGGMDGGINGGGGTGGADADAPLPTTPDLRQTPAGAPRWTGERRRAFIETLAATGSVTRAAAAAGMSRESTYRLRRRADDGGFAEAWDAALACLAEQLTDEAFDRALNGTVETITNAEGEVVERRRFDSRLVTFLLTHHRSSRYGRLAGPQPFNAQEHEDRPLRRFPALLNRFGRDARRLRARAGA